MLGSFLPWHFTGFDFFGLGSWSGMEAGPGLVTAVIGVPLAATGFAAVRRHGTSPFRPEVIGLAVLAFLIVVAYEIDWYVINWDAALAGARYLEPREGEILVEAGAILAAAGGVRLRRPDTAVRAWAVARRPALGLLLAGMVAWELGLGGKLGLRIAPLTYAVVLVALGVGLWPGPLHAIRVRPTTVGILIVLYGALALAAALFAGAGRGLLEIMPFAILLGIGVMRVLGLPTETPQAGSTPGSIDAALIAIASPTALRVAAALLAGAAIVLLVAGLTPLGLPFSTYGVDGSPTDPAWPWWLLALGLLIAVGAVTGLVRDLPRTRRTAA